MKTTSNVVVRERALALSALVVAIVWGVDWLGERFRTAHPRTLHRLGMERRRRPFIAIRA